MRVKRYDYTNKTSYPTSLNLINDESEWYFSGVIGSIPVTPGASLTSKVNARQVMPSREPRGQASLISIHGWDGTSWQFIGADVMLPNETFDWTEFERTVTVPEGIITIRFNPVAGMALSNENPTEVWYDDLRVYQDGELIYENNFTNWGFIVGTLTIGLGILALIRERD